MPLKCKHADYSRFYAEMLCNKYGMPCKVCCVTCNAPEYADEPVKI